MRSVEQKGVNVILAPVMGRPDHRAVTKSIDTLRIDS